MTLPIHGTGRNLALLLSSYMIIDGDRRRTCSFRSFSRMQYDF